MHDTVTGMLFGPSQKWPQFSASRWSHCARDPGPMHIIWPVFIQYCAQCGRSSASATRKSSGCTRTRSRNVRDRAARRVNRFVLPPQNSATSASSAAVPGAVARKDASVSSRSFASVSGDSMSSTMTAPSRS